MASKKKTSKRLPKSTTLHPYLVVDRRWLNDLARSIYDSHKKRFLRLCDGTLQNGPDPTDKTRPMHCGLGELYYAMTGLQPQQTGISEEEVVEMAIKKSTLPKAAEARKTARVDINDMDVPESLKETLLEALDNVDDEDISSDESEFRQILNDIPTENDDGHGDGDAPGNEGHVCDITNFKARSKRVATSLREAAKLLPE